MQEDDILLADLVREGHIILAQRPHGEIHFSPELIPFNQVLELLERDRLEAPFVSAADI